jgi:FixJ family two-component response regulator
MSKNGIARRFSTARPTNGLGESVMADRAPIVFLLDDDEAIGVALGRLLRANGFQTRIYTSALKFLETHDGDTPGCLVTDLRMPSMSGLELQSALLARGIERPIVFITGHGDISTTVQAMKAGAVTFLSKPLQRNDFLAAVREAIARDAEARTKRQEQHEVSGRLASLTARERQVLDLVAVGLLNKQIAAELGAAEKTIKVHRGRIMEKMQVRTATELVSLLFRTESYARSSADGPRRPAFPNLLNTARMQRLAAERPLPPASDTSRDIGVKPPST